MILWGIVVLKLNSHPDHNGPDHDGMTICLTVHGNELGLFGTKAFPFIHTINVAAVDTNFNVFSYAVV